MTDKKLTIVSIVLKNNHSGIVRRGNIRKFATYSKNDIFVDTVMLNMDNLI